MSMPAASRHAGALSIIKLAINRVNATPVNVGGCNIEQKLTGLLGMASL